MSDNATLVSRLRRPYFPPGCNLQSTLDEAAARIAELEAEVARLKARDTLGPYKLIHPDHLAGLDARIAELEAERDELTRLKNIAVDLHQREAGDLYKTRARIAELEAALKPLADAAAEFEWHKGDGSEIYLWCQTGGKNPKQITVKDARIAAAAIRARPAP